MTRLLIRLSFLFALCVPQAQAFDRRSPPVVNSEIFATSLPQEARVTLAAIRRGGPFPYARDGVIFVNRERLLPRRPRGYYTEYTVRTPGSRDRGARRIIVGGDPQSSGEYYYTEDHYQTFRRIRE